MNAATDVTVGGLVLHRATGDGLAGDSQNANKTFVDAYITIAPPAATNPVNTTHTYTAHVFVNTGSGYTDAPDGTVVMFAFVGAHVGSFSAGSQCTISNDEGTCTIDTTSASPGNDTMQASTTVDVGGLVVDPDDWSGGSWTSERRERGQELGRGEDHDHSGKRVQRDRGTAHVDGDRVEGHR